MHVFRFIFQSFMIMLVLISGSVLQWVLLGAQNPFQEKEILPGTVVKATRMTTIVEGTETPKPVPPPPGKQLGIIYPRWGPTVYGKEDIVWINGLVDIKEQTAAHWIQITINLYQDTISSVEVKTPDMASTPENLKVGIGLAQEMGYRVFVTPLLTVGGEQPWAGSIQHESFQQAQKWFESYWIAVAPYARAAQEAGADQFAIGAELEALQQVSPMLWEQLITRFRSVFHGKLVYNMNWPSLYKPISVWMKDPQLDAIGVSTYIPLVDTDKPQRLTQQEISNLWSEKVGRVLDTFALNVGKPVLISELGYRNRADALFRPWERREVAPLDLELQAAAYTAALSHIKHDPLIIGVFFWAWTVPLFQPNGQPAADVLYDWYIAPWP